MTFPITECLVKNLESRRGGVGRGTPQGTSGAFPFTETAWVSSSLSILYFPHRELARLLQAALMRLEHMPRSLSPGTSAAPLCSRAQHSTFQWWGDTPGSRPRRTAAGGLRRGGNPPRRLAALAPGVEHAGGEAPGAAPTADAAHLAAEAPRMPQGRAVTPQGASVLCTGTVHRHIRRVRAPGGRRSGRSMDLVGGRARRRSWDT